MPSHCTLNLSTRFLCTNVDPFSFDSTKHAWALECQATRQHDQSTLWIQHQLQPSKQNRFNFVSSEKMTYSQTWMVQCSWHLANSSPSLMCLSFNFGFFCFSFDLSLATRKTLLTVSTLTVTWHSSRTCLIAYVANSNPPDVTALIHAPFCVSLNACGLPPLLVGISDISIYYKMACKTESLYSMLYHLYFESCNLFQSVVSNWRPKIYFHKLDSVLPLYV